MVAAEGGCALFRNGCTGVAFGVVWRGREDVGVGWLGVWSVLSLSCTGLLFSKVMSDFTALPMP